MKGVWRAYQIRKLRYTLWLLNKGLKSSHPDFYLGTIPFATNVAVTTLYVTPISVVLVPFYFSIRNYDQIGVFLIENPFSTIFALLSIIPTVFLINSMQKWAKIFESSPKWLGGDPDMDILLKITETQAKLKALTDA